MRWVELDDLITETGAWAAKIRKDLHRWPELGNEEYRTAERIQDELERLGIKNKRVISTGVIGELNQSPEKKTVALRADMDALPMKESAVISFTSERKGLMHACGHDVHMAVLLGTARVLNEIKNRINGNVKFIFQPAEETTGGAKRMILRGCLKPKTDFVLGLHVKPELPAGTIGIQFGKVHAASDQFCIVVRGKNSHGAFPESGVDSIVAAAQIICGIQSIVSRNVSPMNSSVITVGSVNGGTAVNLIADEVVLEGTLRSLDHVSRDYLKQRVRELASLTARAYGARAEVKFTEGYPLLINDNLVVETIRQALICNTSVEKVVELKEPSMGVEDFAYFLEQVPGAFFFLGSGYKGRENAGIHTGEFEVDEKCISVGIQAEVAAVLSLLE